jgi:hypothetical protein
VTREAIQALAEMGPLPAASVAAEDVLRLENYQRLLESVEKPITDEEARVLVRLFGPDDCFGLAWALVHLVESAPGWPLLDDVPDAENEWVQLLRERSEREARS